MRQRLARPPQVIKELTGVAKPEVLSLPALKGAWSWVALLTALAEPVVGLLLWLLYAQQPGARSRRLGWAFLALAVLGGILEAFFGNSAEGLAERSIQSYY